MNKGGKEVVHTATGLAKPLVAPWRLALQPSSDLVPLLRLLTRAKGFALAFVKCNVLTQRERLVDDVSQSLKGQERSVRRLDLREPVVDLLEEILRLGPPLASEDVLFVLGFERSIPAEIDFPPALVKLNLSREHFRSLPCPLVIVLPDYALTQLARQAPDFWAWRSGVFEVSVQPEELATIVQREVSLADRDLRSLSPERIRNHLEVLQEVLAEYEAREHSDRERLDLSMQIAADLLFVGERERARIYAEKVVELARKLRDLPAQAEALSSLAVILTNLGRYEDALGVARQAVEIFRFLARENPNSSEGLARSLGDLGTILGFLARAEEALGAVQEAVELFQQWVPQNPESLPELALVLNNLGIALGDLGRREEALVAMREAAEIWRSLSAENPERFLPDLASSLSNISGNLRNLERWEEALVAAKEAVEIYRRLPMKRLETFAPALASSLNNLGTILRDQGRREDALRVTEEAVQLLRDVSSSRSDLFLPNLAVTLVNRAVMLGALGRLEEALQTALEAAEIRRRLKEEYGYTFPPDFAKNLDTFVNLLASRNEDERLEEQGSKYKPDH